MRHWPLETFINSRNEKPIIGNRLMQNSLFHSEGICTRDVTRKVLVGNVDFNLCMIFVWQTSISLILDLLQCCS